MVRIQIANEFIELGEVVDIPLNFSVADISDVSSRRSSFSKTIVVPGTDINNNIFRHHYSVNVSNGEFVNKIVKCSLISSGGEIIFSNGVIKLLRVIKLQNTATGDDKVNYEILLRDDAGGFITNIGDKKLEDIFFQDFNHRYDLATVTASFAHSSSNGYKYILPWIEPLNLDTDRQYKLTELKASIYAKTYLDRLFLSNGYTYTWDDATLQDFQFDKLLIPYNGDVPKLTQQDVQQFRIVAELSEATTFPLAGSFDNDVMIPPFIFPDGLGRAQTILTTEIEDIQSLYNPTTGVHIPNYDSQNPGGINYSFEIDYDDLSYNMIVMLMHKEESSEAHAAQVK
jgi:hypothetical protein